MLEHFYTVPGCPVRLALVSDLHERPSAPALESLRRNRPELICVAGDFFYGSAPKAGPKIREARGVLPFFKSCAEIAPTFVSLGNHEWMFTAEDAAILAETGVTLLDNRFTALRLGDRELCLGGLSSGYLGVRRRASGRGHRKDLGRSARHVPELAWLGGFCASPGYHILLSHHPEYYPRYLREMDIELILSGHAHGGQIRLFGRGLYAPGQGVLPTLTEGITDGRLVISRGLANTVPVPRLFNPTEIVYVSGE